MDKLIVYFMSPLFLVAASVCLIEDRIFAKNQKDIPRDTRDNQTLTATRNKVEFFAKALMNEFDITYTWGGHAVFDRSSCLSCTQCLKGNNYLGKVRPQALNICESCKKCTLDCSHFTWLVYHLAQLPLPYLHTPLMVSLSKEKLYRNYKLLVVDGFKNAQKGDLLVYKRHVGILLEKRGLRKGDMIHATSGRSVRGPGQGIQLIYNTDLMHFKGGLKRVLRHKGLDLGQGTRYSSRQESLRLKKSVWKIRPVKKRQATDN